MNFFWIIINHYCSPKVLLFVLWNFFISYKINFIFKWTLIWFYYFIWSLHTYIIGHYNPLVRIIDLISHTTYVVCVDFIHKWRDLQFKVGSERQIFCQFYLFLRVFARNVLRGNRWRNTFRISFWCLTWDSNPGFSSNKPTH